MPNAPVYFCALAGMVAMLAGRHRRLGIELARHHRAISHRRLPVRSVVGRDQPAGAIPRSRDAAVRRAFGRLVGGKPA